MHRIFFYMFMIIMPICTAMAGTVSDDIKKAWNYYSFDIDNGTTDDFMADGGVGEKSKTGNWACKSFDKENQTASKGFAAVVAQKIVEHGGYFCPSQVQCDSRNRGDGQHVVWFSWYNPNGKKGCAWLCDEGYAGVDCAPVSGVNCSDKTYKLTNNDTSAFGAISMYQNYKQKTRKKDCKDMPEKIDSNIPYFEVKTNPAKGVVLGVTKFLDHGVIAAPIKLECAHRNKERAWFNRVSLADGKPRILCAEGYRPLNDDCIAIDRALCENPTMKFCDGFLSDKYDMTQHTIDTDTVNKCKRYRCTDDTMAFASATDTTCSVKCVTDIKSGVNTKTGLCEKCKTGEYFKEKENKCVDAKKYSKDELQYGKSKRTEDSEITEQCWTMFGDLYRFCIPK